MTSESPTARTADASLVAFFQPFYNLSTGEMQGIEALARRRQPTTEQATLPAGLTGEEGETADISPRDIDLFILDDALGRLARWSSDPEWEQRKISVNLSVEFTTHPTMLDDILTALTRHGIGTERLLLDLSVDAYRRTTDSLEFPEHVRALRDGGITTCLDGFTIDDLDVFELALLNRVDIVKLHPSQPGMGEDMLRYVAERVHEQGVPLVAAGVETQEQLDLVRTLGFEWAQGYLIGVPVEGDDVLSAPTRLTR